MLSYAYGITGSERTQPSQCSDDRIRSHPFKYLGGHHIRSGPLVLPDHFCPLSPSEMPKRKSYRGRARSLRRSYVKRRLRFRAFRRSRRRGWLARPRKSGMPTRVRMVHKYADTIALSAGAGTNAVWLFSCNSVYDPDRTAAGHQPMLHDQFAALYNNYIVTKAKIKVTFFPNGSQMTVGCSVLPDTTTTYVGNLRQAAENAHSTVMNIEDTETRPIVMRRVQKASSYIGKPMFNRDLWASTGANPPDECYFAIFAGASDMTSTPSAMRCIVQIWYYTIWSQPIAQDTS